MQHSVLGFNVRVILKYNIDPINLYILKWIYDFAGTSRIRSIEVNNKKYFWISYKKLIEDLPYLKIKSKDAVYKRLKQLCDQKILEKYVSKEEGNLTYFAINYEIKEELFSSFDMVSDENRKGSDENQGVSDENRKGIGRKSDRVSDENRSNKIYNNKKPNKKNNIQACNKQKENDIFMTVPVKSGKPYPITKKQIENWQKTFHLIDVQARVCSLVSWFEANPDKQWSNSKQVHFALPSKLAKYQEEERKNILTHGGDPDDPSGDKVAECRIKKTLELIERTKVKPEEKPTKEILNELDKTIKRLSKKKIFIA